MDSPDHIYFRVDDVIEKGTIIDEGIEVEFFIIAENSKGKMADRAVHLSILPVGSVMFEVGYGTGVLGTVSKQPQTSPREEPGIFVLHEPITREGDLPNISEIELWPRCMPSALICKVNIIFILYTCLYTYMNIFHFYLH